MDNPCIHFEEKMLSGTILSHEACQNKLHLFAEYPESVFRSVVSLLSCTLHGLAVLDWVKISVKSQDVQTSGYHQSLEATKRSNKRNFTMGKIQMLHQL